MNKAKISVKYEALQLNKHHLKFYFKTYLGVIMTMDTLVLENLTVNDLPLAWVEKFHPQPEQRFTVYIISETASTSTPIVKKISAQQERFALMREMARQLNETGDEDSEEWSKAI